MAYGFGGITEHLVALEEKKYRLPRQLIVGVGGGAVILALLIAGVLIPALFPLFLLLAAGAGFLVWFLWRYTQVEYEYLIAEGEMSFSAVYGKKSRRDLYSFPIREAERIVAYQDEKKKCDSFPADETRFYAGRFDDEDTMCALITREDGKKARIFFQGTPEALAAFSRVNRRAVKGSAKKKAAAAEEEEASEEA